MSGRAHLLVNACQCAIVVTGLTWAASGLAAATVVASVALGLSLVPARVIAEPSLRDATQTVTAVLLAAHVVLGMGLGLYESSTLYDKAVHALGFGAIAVLLTHATRLYCDRHDLDLPVAMTAGLVLGGTVSIGVAWELFEFTVDLTGVFVAQRGLDDTMLDLLADTLGALTVVAGFSAVRGVEDRVLALG